MPHVDDIEPMELEPDALTDVPHADAGAAGAVASTASPNQAGRGPSDSNGTDKAGVRPNRLDRRPSATRRMLDDVAGGTRALFRKALELGL